MVYYATVISFICGWVFEKGIFLFQCLSFMLVPVCLFSRFTFLVPIMASEGVDHSDWYSPIANRISGSRELQLAHAEYLYEQFGYHRLDKPSTISEPVDLQLLALEAFRKQVFIKEWLLANERSWLVDELFVYDYTVFKKADFILYATVSQLCNYIHTHLGMNLQGNRYVFSRFFDFNFVS